MARHELTPRTAELPQPLRLLIGWPQEETERLTKRLRPLKRQRQLQWRCVAPSAVPRQLQRRDQYHVLLTSAAQFAAWPVSIRKLLGEAVSLLLLFPDALPIDIMPTDLRVLRAVLALPEPCLTPDLLVERLCQALIAGRRLSHIVSDLQTEQVLWGVVAHDAIWPPALKADSPPQSAKRTAQPTQKQGGDALFGPSNIQIGYAQFGNTLNVENAGYIEHTEATQGGGAGWFNLPSSCSQCEALIPPGDRFCQACGQEST